jgi:hypothetical protein
LICQKIQTRSESLFVVFALLPSVRFCFSKEVGTYIQIRSYKFKSSIGKDSYRLRLTVHIAEV